MLRNPSWDGCDATPGAPPPRIKRFGVGTAADEVETMSENRDRKLGGRRRRRRRQRYYYVKYDTYRYYYYYYTGFVQDVHVHVSITGISEEENIGPPGLGTEKKSIAAGRLGRRVFYRGEMGKGPWCAPSSSRNFKNSNGTDTDVLLIVPREITAINLTYLPQPRCP